MPTTFKIRCPSCNAGIRVPVDRCGTRVGCPRCATLLSIGFPQKTRARGIAIGLFGCLAVGTLMAGVVSWLLLRDSSNANHPLIPYRHLLPTTSSAVLHIDFVPFRQNPEFSDAFGRFEIAMKRYLNGLRLHPMANDLQAVLAVETPGAPFRVWRFRDPVAFGGFSPGQYEARVEGSFRILVDRTGSALAWAINQKGWLLQGTVDDLRSALANEQSDADAPAYGRLQSLARGVPKNVPAWFVLDLKAAIMKDSAIWPPGPIDGAKSLCAYADESPDNWMFNTVIGFATENDAESAHRRLLRSQTLFAQVPFAINGTDWPDILIRGHSERKSDLLHITDRLRQPMAVQIIRRVTATFDSASEANESSLANVRKSSLASACASLEAGKLDESLRAFRKCAEHFPLDEDTRTALASAEELERHINKIRTLVDHEDFGAAEHLLTEAAKMPKSGALVAAIAKDIGSRKNDRDFRYAYEQARKAVEHRDYKEARSRYSDAKRARPDSPGILAELEVVARLEESEAAFRASSSSLAGSDLAKAGREAADCLRSLRESRSMIVTSLELDSVRNQIRKACLDHLADVVGRFTALVKEKGDSMKAASLAEPVDDVREKCEQALMVARSLRSTVEDILSDADDSTMRIVEPAKSLADEVTHECLAMKDDLVLRQATDTLQSAEAKLNKVTRDSALLHTAKKEIEKADDLFQQTRDRTREAAASFLKRSASARSRAAKLDCPFDIDFGKHDLPDFWRFDKARWNITKLEKGFLRVTDGTAATLLTQAEDWPSCFLFEMEFAMLHDSNKFDNRRWAYSPDQLVVTFCSDKQPAGTELRFGRDMVSNEFGVHMFRMALDGKVHRMPKLKRKELTSILLQVYRREGGTFAVYVNDTPQPVATCASSLTYRQIKLTAYNQERDAPVIFRMALRNAANE
jgi:hypothetical protein